MHNSLDFFTVVADMLTIGGCYDVFSITPKMNDEKADEQTCATKKPRGRQLFKSFSRVVADEQGGTGQKGPCVGHHHFPNRRRLPVPDGHEAKNHPGTWPQFV